MKSIRISKKRINSLSILNQFDLNSIQIGLPVLSDEAVKVGLQNIGDAVLPDGSFGIQSKRNAYGYSYADKTKPKKRRIVSTNWIYPFGNTNATQILVDITRKCYPCIEVPPNEIELCLIENENGEAHVVVRLTDYIRHNLIKEAINLMLEIFGLCYVYDSEKSMKNEFVPTQRCNWEILPPGEMPSRHIERILQDNGRKTDTFDVHRLRSIEKYHANDIVEGKNGFSGYYVFVFDDICVLESAWYGNATFIIPFENWQMMTQMTKQELCAEKNVKKRIVHRKSWEQEMEREFAELGIKKD